MNIFNKITNFFKTPFKKMVKRSFIPQWFPFFNRDLATNDTIFSAVNMISNAIASAPVGVYKNGQKLKPSEHNLAELFEFGVNQRMTMFEFIKTMEVNRCTDGVGYAIKEYGYGGQVTQIGILNSDYVEPIIEEYSGELYYKISGVQEPRYVHNSNIIAVNFMTKDGFTPINPLDVLRNAIDYDYEVKEFSLNQMKKALKANYVIKLPETKLSKENIDEYDEMFEDFVKAGVIYLDAGKEINELSSKSFLDPNLAIADKITIERVERVYGLNGKLSRTADNNNSTDTEDLIYLKDAILPIIRQYEQELSKKLLTYKERMEGYKIKFAMQGFARGQMSVRSQFYQIMFRNSLMTANEIRALEDMPPVENGDIRYLSRDLWQADNYDEFMKSSIKNPTETR